MSFTFVKATQTSLLKNYHIFQQKPKAAYYQQNLHIIGLEGSGVIEIYSIIGNKIKEIIVQELNNFKTYLNLESGNMYILRVKMSGNIHTFKLIASH
tara:strand:- start:139 stop:429 length:291 start_codon:yes stop_codon:yes gene_type:complete